MATFQGTIQEFHDYLGPRIRNQVNNLTRLARKSRNGVCEHCGKVAELESAHKKEHERRSIIEEVLSANISEGIVRCDIGEAEKMIINAHTPIEQTFFFLCSTCHHKYDNGSKKPRDMGAMNLEGREVAPSRTIRINPQSNNTKIGRHVQSVLSRFIRNNKINDFEKNNLLNEDYCHRTFGLNYPFLRKMQDGREDDSGYPRYYSHIWVINGKNYYFCSQWYERQRQQFNEWVFKFEPESMINPPRTD